MAHTIVQREVGGRPFILETGKVAKLADAAVLATYGDTTVLATVVRAKPREGIDFFPLQVDYRERTSAAGKFPGGFRKREGAPNEKEILTMRMIDRPIRPLFPDGFVEEVQVQCWVMSHDTENDSDVIAATAASAALAISSVPFQGPLATIRVGRIPVDDEMKYVVNPTISQLDFSDLDMVLSGHRDGFNMIEVGAAEVPEDAVLGAMEFGYQYITELLDMIDELVEKAGKPKDMGDYLYQPDEEVIEIVNREMSDKLREARLVPGKMDRDEKVNELRQQMLDELFPEPGEDATPYQIQVMRKKRSDAVYAFRKLEKKLTRQLIVQEGRRADGRALDELRPIECEVGIFHRTHGSAMFQRGETQSLVSATLGTTRDEQIVDGLLPEYSKRFMLHYNFPPFCTGEARRIMGPGRREIGHGALAERSLMGVLPADTDEFPYTVRIVSDITESNGSSSMASVCGGCLALMDAGVPIANTVAGISIGRVEEDGREVFLTDIIGEEDFFGDMDFKVAGSREGITGIQLDLKARGLVLDQVKVIFERARQTRLQIIDIMEQCIPAPREHISKYAPAIVKINIDPERIGKLIGPGGKTIRAIQDNTGARIEVEEDGTVYISSPDQDSLQRAKAEIEALVEDVKVGSIYEGKVMSVKDFGAFVEIAPGTDGLCHISELAEGYVKNASDVVKVGDIVRVKVIQVDEQGRVKLSRKRVLKEEKEKVESTTED
ncbi:MAG TPA: polyribonucleotide nucleotidyltransferase [Phycisphaeraceae bacterium]|nr:polyribonucleotide nucleotidyltransferase [Phycisphaeraceae bacterium]